MYVFSYAFHQKYHHICVFMFSRDTSSCYALSVGLQRSYFCCNHFIACFHINVSVSTCSCPLLSRLSISLRCRYTIRFARAEPCDCPVHRPIVTCGVLVECSGPMKIGLLGIRARSISQPIMSHLLCEYPIRAQWPFKSTFTSFNHDGEDGLRLWMHWKAPMLLRDICVSCNMEFFCRTNIKPRNALPVTLDCSQYDGSRFKKYRQCHGLCV